MGFKGLVVDSLNFESTLEGCEKCVKTCARRDKLDKNNKKNESIKEKEWKKPKT